MKWKQFEAYLLQRMTPKSAGDRLRYAKQFASVLQTGNAQSLLQLAPNKRIHVMKALASLSRFLGSYDVWLQIRQRYNLHWSTGNENLSTFQRFFDDSKTMDTMLQWVKNTLEVLPAQMGEAIKWSTLTGLRPAESLQAIRLINDPIAFKTVTSAKKSESLKMAEVFIQSITF